MITGYKDFYYNVSDMDRAVKFYKQALQMMVEGESDKYWTSMRVGNLTLGLHGSEGVAIPTTVRNAHGQENGGTVTFSSTDITEDRARIITAGGKILGEANQPWGHMLVFEDLDGNVLKLMK
ncbi:MAG: VOC family protein [Rhizobacter sp.]|nr:VOC family protein [Bacteriovorax sp.]